MGFLTSFKNFRAGRQAVTRPRKKQQASSGKKVPNITHAQARQLREQVAARFTPKEIAKSLGKGLAIGGGISLATIAGIRGLNALVEKRNRKTTQGRPRSSRK